MNIRPSIAIVGAGAVGGYYGALLQRAGNDVHFLLRSDFDHVQQNGFKIDSCNGDFELTSVNAYQSAADMPRCDLIIVALKTTANAVLPDILPHLIKDNSAVLTLQNGLGSEDEIARIVGAECVLGGLCFLCANKIAPGHIRHLDYGLITVGEYCSAGKPRGITPRLERVGQLLSNAGISIQLIEDLTLGRWKKLVWNIPFNGMSVACDTLTDQLIKQPELRNRCETMMHEVAKAAISFGREIDEAFIQKMLIDTEKMRPYAPSMKLDFDRGQPMEIESIYGNPLRAAQANGVSMPETERLYQQLLALDPR
ncbi:MAG: putative 2-dehydropantoate 2-reductase [Pontiellaceae bacterium]|nr:putative 2-dehydropantoate 2-reductase [Pontiellaceae bacterium]